MLAVAPLAQLIQLLKTLFREHKRPELSPAWFVVVALQRIHGVRPQALQARRTELRAVRKPAPPQPQQEGLAFAAGLTAELASKVRLLASLQHQLTLLSRAIQQPAPDQLAPGDLVQLSPDAHSVYGGYFLHVQSVGDGVIRGSLLTA